MPYVTGRRRAPQRPRSLGYYDDDPLIPHLEVDGPDHVDTGLVTERGEPIYRTQPPIGFGRDDEW